MFKVLFGLALIISLTACNQSTEQTANNSDITARQDLMQDWRMATETLKGMSENPTNFDMQVLKEQAQLLKDTTPTMWTHFNDNAKGGNAKDTIWTDKAGFLSAQEKFAAAVNELHTTAQTAQSATDIEQALGGVGESCGGCHKAFKN